MLNHNEPQIPELNLGQLFEPHFSTRPEASGLRLTLCRDLLLTVGGRITVSNATEGGMCAVVVR